MNQVSISHSCPTHEVLWNLPSTIIQTSSLNLFPKHSLHLLEPAASPRGSGFSCIPVRRWPVSPSPPQGCTAFMLADYSSSSLNIMSSDSNISYPSVPLPTASLLVDNSISWLPVTLRTLKHPVEGSPVTITYPLSSASVHVSSLTLSWVNYTSQAKRSLLRGPCMGSHAFLPPQKRNPNNSFLYWIILGRFLLHWIILINIQTHCCFLHLNNPVLFPLHSQSTTPFFCNPSQQNSLKELFYSQLPILS